MPTVAVTGDFNRDGKIDIAVGSAAGISVLLGHGDGTFKAQKLYSATGSITGLAQAAVRQDGIDSLLGVDSAHSRFGVAARRRRRDVRNAGVLPGRSGSDRHRGRGFRWRRSAWMSR